MIANVTKLITSKVGSSAECGGRCISASSVAVSGGSLGAHLNQKVSGRCIPKYAPGDPAVHNPRPGRSSANRARRPLRDAIHRSDHELLIDMYLQHAMPDFSALRGGVRGAPRFETASAASTASGMSGALPDFPLVS